MPPMMPVATEPRPPPIVLPAKAPRAPPPTAPKPLGWPLFELMRTARTLSTVPMRTVCSRCACDAVKTFGELLLLAQPDMASEPAISVATIRRLVVLIP
jgi:hypothetical protein